MGCAGGKQTPQDEALAYYNANIKMQAKIGNCAKVPAIDIDPKKVHATIKTPEEMKTAMESFKMSSFLFQEFGEVDKPMNHHISYKF
jgi:hypothetical protein